MSIRHHMWSDDLCRNVTGPFSLTSCLTLWHSVCFDFNFPVVYIHIWISSDIF